MISKNESLQTLKSMIAETTDENKKTKLIGYIEKINSVTENQFYEIAKKSLGEECRIDDFIKWVNVRLNHELVGTKFVELNDMVSYNIAGSKADTIALHVVPKHVTKTDIRNMGPYLVDALNQLREKVKNNDIKGVTNIFAVSPILRAKKLQEGFRNLGFEVKKGDEAFQEHFDNPYQAEISIEKIISDEWKKIRDEYMESQPNIDVHAREKDINEINNTDINEDSENR